MIKTQNEVQSGEVAPWLTKHFKARHRGSKYFVEDSARVSSVIISGDRPKIHNSCGTKWFVILSHEYYLLVGVLSDVRTGIESNI